MAANGGKFEIGSAKSRRRESNKCAKQCKKENDDRSRNHEDFLYTPPVFWTKFQEFKFGQKTIITEGKNHDSFPSVGNDVPVSNNVMSRSEKLIRENRKGCVS